MKGGGDPQQNQFQWLKNGAGRELIEAQISACLANSDINPT
jgi:hypothetical protein